MKYVIAFLLAAFCGAAFASTPEAVAAEITIGGLTLEELALWAGAIVTALSLLSQAITKITGVTESTKDDELAGVFARFVGMLQAVLGVLTRPIDKLPPKR